MKSLITLQRKDGYILKGAHDRGQLSLLLTNTIEGIQFTLALADLSLNEEAKSLFGNTENIWICLSESSDYEVIPATGILLLKAPRRFPILKLRMARGEEGLPQAPEKDQSRVEKRFKEMEEQIMLKNSEGMETLLDALAKERQRDRADWGILVQENQQLKQQLLETIATNARLSKQVEEIGLKCEILESKFTQVLDRLSEQQRQEPPKGVMQARDKTEDFVDKSCKGAYNLKIDDNRIIYQGTDSCQVLTNVQVKLQSSLKFKIHRSFEDTVSLGVIDSSYADEYYSWYRRGHKNVIWYTPGKGLFESGMCYKVPGLGFGEGDEVIVHVESQEGFISWIRNGEASYRHKMAALKSPNINWVFFILFHHKFDMVEILG